MQPVETSKSMGRQEQLFHNAVGFERSYNLKTDLHQIKQLGFTDSFTAELLWWSLILWIRESNVP